MRHLGLESGPESGQPVDRARKGVNSGAMFRSPVHLLRMLALTEAVSFLILLFVAMPLKYLAHWPMAVKVSGWLHGLLFVLLCFQLLKVTLEYRWPLKRSTMIFIAALLPFGPFFIDSRLKQLEE